MNRLISDVRAHALDLLGNEVGLDQEAADLHHCLFNESYFIIGTYQAIKWLG